MSSKRHPEELNAEAVKQLADRCHVVAEVVAPLGVSTHSPYGRFFYTGEECATTFTDDMEPWRQP